VKAARIDQRLDVLPRRPLAGLAPPRHGLRARRVQGLLVPCDDLGQVGPDEVEVDRLFLHRAAAGVLALLDEGQRMALVDRVAGLDVQRPHHARDLGGDHVLHLHGLHDHQRLAGAHGVADGRPRC
jgi:hypothetical protein